MHLRSIVLFLLALVVMISALYLWGRPRPKVEVIEREEDVVPPPATEPSPLPSPSPMAAPALSEVQPTLDRVFGQTLTRDRATRPAFVAGDFNGDDVTDLAVAVRPRSEGALLELRAEGARCRLQDATAPPTDVVARPGPVEVAARDLLLAVVHGADVGGWRNPDARQCYLVKNAAGSGMRPRPLTGVPDAIRMRAIRSHIGDVIVARRGGGPGVLLWTAATYVWADLGPGDAANARARSAR
jgi:hypothetical protein